MRFSGLSMWSAVTCAIVALVGCGGDGGTGGGGGNQGGGGSSGGETGGTAGTGGETATGGVGGTGGTTSTMPDFSACIGKFDGQEPACQMCIQTNCAESLIACCETAGCPEIVTCARESMCGGTDCYFGPDGMDGPCKQVIDDNGGPLGDAVGVAQEFGMCAQPACPDECAAM